MITACPDCKGTGKAGAGPCVLCGGLGDVSQCVKCKLPIPEGAGRYRGAGGNDSCCPCWEALTDNEKLLFV